MLAASELEVNPGMPDLWLGSSFTTRHRCEDGHACCSHVHTHIHTWGASDGHAWPLCQKNPKPAPYTKMGLLAAEVVIKPGWSQHPACSAAPVVFNYSRNQALVLKQITAAVLATPEQV